MKLLTSSSKNKIKEIKLTHLNFKKHKFTVRPLPENPKQILIMTCFFEFGCETIGVEHCIPEILKSYENYYVICVGWHGRMYLYKHLIDEYWELDEEHQWLRDYTCAFVHQSRNLKKLEIELNKFGKVYLGSWFGNICIAAKCNICKSTWKAERRISSCPKCQALDVKNSLFAQPEEAKKNALKVPLPSEEMIEKVKSLLPKNAVGIFARGRKKYGRNLTKQFYLDLINRLKQLGYNPVWLGEKESILPCPTDDILDVSLMQESNDLEFTLAVISQLQFTIQYWTASTRLASLVNTPWILFETKNQIYGVGHEGKRILLTTDYNKKKIVLFHFANALENLDKIIQLTEQAIIEIKNDNWHDIWGIDHTE